MASELDMLVYYYCFGAADTTPASADCIDKDEDEDNPLDFVLYGLPTHVLDWLQSSVQVVTQFTCTSYIC